MRALILEDNRDRRVAMVQRLTERFPFLRASFFDSAGSMIELMESDDLHDVAIISLDHDLELIPTPHGKWLDPGTGLEVAEWLSKQRRPICPVVIHSTNSDAARKMLRLLKKSHWVSNRVVPHDDLQWIDRDWFKLVRNAIVEFAPERRCEPFQSPANKTDDRSMNPVIHATFADGTFRPDEDPHLPANARVRLTVETLSTSHEDPRGRDAKDTARE